MSTVQHGSWTSAHQRAATTTNLLLLRHGETLLTPERRLSGTGSGDPGLSDRTPPGRGTAHIIAAALDLPVEVDDDLRETDFGDW